MGWPALEGMSVVDPDAYEWLLSDHPWATAERTRRRDAHHRREVAEADAVLAVCDRLAGGSLDRLADTVAPIARDARRRAATKAEVDDASHVAEARRRWETAQRVEGRWGYEYPSHLVGLAAADFPPPIGAA